MARPLKKRRICELPHVQQFGPVCRPEAETVEMTVDEYETIRLIDYLNLSQEDCALQMKVARTTVQSIYDSARKKLAQVLVEGKGLSIGGGAYDVCPMAAQCCGKNCRRGRDGTEPCPKGEKNCKGCCRENQ